MAQAVTFTCRRPAALPRAPRGPARRGCRRPLQPPRAISDWDLTHYTEAVIAEVRTTEKHGHVIMLRLKDGQNTVLPVYVGEFECSALVKEIHKKPAVRPMTHDLMKNTLEALGFRVTKVRVTALVGNTYHARVHFARGRGIKDAEFAEIDVDARPSDAINLAVRFGAAIYVNKEVAARMGHPLQSYPARDETQSEIVRSCKEVMLQFQDPTIMHKLQLQLAIKEERFEDASRLRDVIDTILASDRELSLVVAMETALEDGRVEEAARLRDEFRLLHRSRGLSPLASEVSDAGL